MPLVSRQRFVEPSLGKCLNHVNSPAAGRVLFPANYFFALKVDDSAEFSVAPQIFLLLCQPPVLVIAAEIDFGVIFPVKLLPD